MHIASQYVNASVDDEEGIGSLTRFLTLPTMEARASNKYKDPIVDFTKSVMLTTDTSMDALERKQVERGIKKEKRQKSKSRRLYKKL